MADTTELMLEKFRPLIEKALAETNGACTWDMVVEEVRAGRAFLVPSISGRTVAVLQPVRDLHVFTASGDLDELMGMEADMTEVARAAGYDHMTLNGREGWKRALKTRGWKQQVGLAKDL